MFSLCVCVQKSSQQPSSGERLPLQQQSSTSSVATPRTTQRQRSSSTTTTTTGQLAKGSHITYTLRHTCYTYYDAHTIATQENLSA